MTPERWRQIGSLYQAARGLVPEDRAVFLSGISDGLRDEVEALLARDRPSRRPWLLRSVQVRSLVLTGLK